MSICYGYGRHSTMKQDMTRKAQETRCLRHYQTVLEPEGVEFAEFFYDDAVSGSVPFAERPAGRELFHLARPGDHIVVAKLDRAFRRLADGVATIDMFSKRGVHFHVLDLGVDTRTAIGRFFQQVLLCVGELEREFASQRTKEIIAEKKRAGLPHTHAAPIGWKIVRTPTGRQYRVDEEERRYCDHMQMLADQGKGSSDIAGWCCMQKVFKAKRRFSTPKHVRWAIRARLCGYPKITSLEEFARYWKSRQLALG